MDTVKASDKGSKPQYIKIQVQGVPTSDVIDNCADITIMAGKLLNKIAAATRLRKKDFKKQDHVLHTYDRRQFELHTKIDLEISFDGKVLCTPIYIKMDAHG